MIEKHQEANLLRSLASAYQDIVEARRNAGGGGGGKAPRYVQNAEPTSVGHIQDNAGKVKHVGLDKMKADAKVEKKQMEKQAAKDKAARQERARENKERKAKAGIDDLLKDIRGK